MVGTAERTISARHRAIADELRAMARWPRPPYASSSAFRFVYDRSAARDIADVSAVSQHLGVLIRSVIEQEAHPPQGPEPGTVQRSDDVSAPDPLEPGRGPLPSPPPMPPDGAPPGSGPAPAGQGAVAATIPPAPTMTGPAASPAADGAVDGRPPSAEALLSVPSTVVGRERAEQACRALDNGWFAEAEDLFLAGAAATPTDPFVWFGAGLAATRLDPERAAAHLTRSSRYLTVDDPAGAAYAALMAASLLERAGDPRAARQLLSDRLADLGETCPAILLHLARLGPDYQARAAEAIAVDPMLDADLAALGIDLPGDVVKDNQSRIERDLQSISDLIAELRRVDGGPPSVVRAGGGAPAGDRLSLAGTEVQLWQRMRICQNEIDLARRAVETREQLRRQKEREIADTTAIAEKELDAGIGLSYFGLCVMISVAVVATFFVARWLIGANPGFARPIGALAWLVEIALVVMAISAFLRAWWPRRRYQAARQARSAIPQLELNASELLHDEFLVRRRYGRARGAAELTIRRIIDRREVLVPNRPRFLSADLPLVAARD